MSNNYCIQVINGEMNKLSRYINYLEDFERDYNTFLQDLCRKHNITKEEILKTKKETMDDLKLYECCKKAKKLHEDLKYIKQKYKSGFDIKYDIQRFNIDIKQANLTIPKSVELEIQKSEKKLSHGNMTGAASGIESANSVPKVKNGKDDLNLQSIISKIQNLLKKTPNDTTESKPQEQTKNDNISNQEGLNSETKSDAVVNIQTWTMPVNATVSSPYGWRYHPILKKQRLHKGVDFAAAKGTPIKSPCGGVITFAAYEGPNGNCIRINHGKINGKILSSTLIHLDTIKVSKGQIVKQGQVIGTVGSTGKYPNGSPSSTGPHLHISVYENGQHVDPFKYINKSKF